jgi:hypothetical protein
VLTEIQRRSIASPDQMQMCILFLQTASDANAVQREILRLGGKPTLFLPRQAVMCVLVRTDAADALKGLKGVRHVGPGSFTSRVRKLTVRTDSNGKPLWRYELDDNNNIRMVRTE